MPKPPTPSTRRISNSPNRVPGGSASWSVPDDGDRGLAEGGWMGAHRSVGRPRPRRDRELTAGPCPEPPSAGGRVPRRRSGLKIAPFSQRSHPQSVRRTMATILQHLPVGEKRRHRLLGRPRHQRRAALDARQGRDPLRLHRQPRPARRARLRRHPAPGAAVRRREGAPDRLPRAARRRRPRGAAVRRLPHLDRRRHLLQHDAARPRRHRHDAGRRR